MRQQKSHSLPQSQPPPLSRQLGTNIPLDELKLKHHLSEMTSKSQGDGDKPVMTLARKTTWASWLRKHHDTSSGVWLRLAKKSSRLESVSYDEALDVALCYGWIDGQSKSAGETHWLLKFTPRAKRSIWSKRNKERVLALIANGEMRPAGLVEVERAKNDGRWVMAYESPRRITVPGDLQAALDKNERARYFFDNLDVRNRYAILFRIHTARKAETRAKRIQQYVEMLARNEKVYP
jgi:uncharacterized protein YdeI (YjbR/CyaY-like superfamily)